LQSYVIQLEEQVSFFVDSASGERREIDGESIPLVLFSGESFDDKIGSGSDATQKDLICPISLQIMQGPFKWSDGKTYERAEIERWF